MSTPAPDKDDSLDFSAETLGIEPHVAGLAAGELVLPRCHRCQHIIWYPRTFCPACGSIEIDWFTATGRGTVYSFTVVRRSTGPYETAVPYLLAYVELEEGPRVLTNILGPHEEIHVGTPVRAVFGEQSAFPSLCFAPLTEPRTGP